MKTFLSLLMTCFLLACDCQETNPTVCGTENPAENLPWLKNMIESWASQSEIYPYQYVQQGEYQGQTVFLPGNCCPFCITITGVYDCEGELLWYASEEPDKANLIKNLKVIWKPVGFQCQLQ
jgi:hypothetical protein